MALYVDTALEQEVRNALALGVVAGVTTNPTLIKRTGQCEEDALREIARLEPSQLFVQLAGKTEAELTTNLTRIRQLCPSTALVFKITPTWPAIRLCARWHEREDFLVTAVNTVEQAYVAQEAGAKYIAVYLHRYRLRHGSWPPVDEIKRMTQGRLRVMMASCHDIAEVRWSLVSACDDITLPLSTIQPLLFSKDSEDDIMRFDQDLIRSPRH